MKRMKGTFISSRPIFRIISCILISVMLINTNVLSICAVADEIKEAVAYSIASNYVPDGTTEISDTAITADLTPIESEIVLNDLGSDSVSTKKHIYRYAPAEAEAKLRELCKEYTLFSLCPQDKYDILWDFLAVSQDDIPAMLSAYQSLQQQNYNLYDSSLILQTKKVSGFTVEEAVQLMDVYPQTASRMLELRQLTAYYPKVQQSDKASIKQYFLQGYPTRNIKAAFEVSQKLDIPVASLITKSSSSDLKSSSKHTDDVNAVLTLYPVNPDALTQHAATQSASLQTTSQAELSLLDTITGTTETASVVSTSSTTSSSSGTLPGWTKDIAAPFTISLSASGLASLATGSSYYQDTLVSIPGRGGFDLVLNLTYNSATSNTTRPELSASWYEYQDGYMIYEYVECYDPDGNLVSADMYNLAHYATEEEATSALSDYTDYSDTDSSGYTTYYSYGVTEETFSNLSSLDATMVENDRATDLAVGWSWGLPSIDTAELSDGSTFLPLYANLPGLGQYTLNSYTNNEGGTDWSVYAETMSSSRYASEISMIEQDTFSNGVESSTYRISATTNGHWYYFREDGKIIGERDAFGNIIKYQYDTSKRLTKIIDSASRQITFSYVDSGTTRTITIALPDNNTIVLTLTKLTGNLYTLTKIKKQNNTECTFTYAQVSSDTVYKSGYTDEYDNEIVSASTAVTYLLLNQIQYPTGAVLTYTYTNSTQDGEQLTQQLYRVLQGTITNASGTTLYRQRYSYVGSHIAQATDGNKVTITYDDNSTQVYVFNKLNLMTSATTYSPSNTITYREMYSYFGPGLLTLKSITPYATGYTNGVASDTWTRNGNGLITQHKTDSGATVDYPNPSWMPYPSLSETATPQGTLYTVMEAGYLPYSKAEYFGYYQDDYYSGVNADTYTTYQNDGYGNRVSERKYTTIPDYESDGVYQETTYVYGPCTGNSTASLYLTGIKYGSTTVESYGYDIMGRMTSKTDGMSNVTSTTYDSMGRVLTVKYPDGGSESYAYNDTANTVTHTTVNGGKYKYTYDPIGQLKSVTRMSDSKVIMSYTYDTLGRVTEETNAQSLDSTTRTVYTYVRHDDYATKKVYNSSGTLVYSESVTWTTGTRKATISGIGGETMYVETVRNGHRQPVSEKSYTTSTSYAKSTTYSYDIYQNLTRVYNTGPDAPARTDYSYDYLNRLIKTTDALGNYSTITYDNIGNKVSERGFDGVVTTYTYDTRGRVTSQSTPFNSTTTTQKQYTYDNANRVTQEKQSDNADNSTTVTWRTTAYAYDSMGRVTDIYVPAKQVGAQHTHYVYNTAGNLTKAYSGSLTSTTSPSYTNYSLIQYAYNTYGQQTSVTDALGKSDTYTYDANGYLITEVTRDSRTINYTYDALGRETQRKVTVGGVVKSTRTTTYDGASRVLSISEDGYTITNSYAHNNLTQVSESDGSVKSYTYNTSGMMTGYTLKIDGVTKDSATYTYDNMRRLTGVTSDGMTITYTYDAAGRRLTDTYADERQVAYTYNSAGLLTGVDNLFYGYSEYDDETGDPIGDPEYLWTSDSFGASYRYNTDGTQRSRTENGTVTTYTYDDSGRLVSECGTSSISYTYDGRGNRTAMTKDGVSTSYTYNLANQLLTEVSQGVTKTYTYNNAGNLTTVKNGSTTLNTYTYDAWGRQTGYTAPQDLITATYTYGPDDLRRSKTVGSTTTEFVWSGGNMVYESTGSSGTVYRYGATLFASDDGTATYTYLLNGHGDVTQMLAGTTVVKSYNYDAFGNEIGINTADTNPFRYCAQYYDKESGTIYLRARYYAPGLGRFTQQDAWEYADSDEPQSLNLYVYCINDPVGYFDYGGNLFISTTVLCIAGFAALFGTAGGIGGYCIAKNTNVANEDIWKYVAVGTVSGAIIGGIGGYYAAPSIIAHTQIAGISLSASGISAVGQPIITAVDKLNKVIADSSLYSNNISGNVYYHITTLENAEKIINTGELLPGEGGRIFVTSTMPSLSEVTQLGSRGAEVVIQFVSNTNLFVPDQTVNPIIKGALMSNITGVSLKIFEPVVKILS